MAFPASLVETLHYYRTPREAQINPDLAAFVHLGCHIAHRVKFGNDGDPHPARLSRDVPALLKFDASAFPALLDTIDIEIAKAEDFVFALNL